MYIFLPFGRPNAARCRPSPATSSGSVQCLGSRAKVLTLTTNDTASACGWTLGAFFFRFFFARALTPTLEMEDLLRSLRGLGLKPPAPDQLLDLLDADQEVQKRLAAELALQPDGDDAGLITKDIIDAGVVAILETFRRSLSKDQELVRAEVSAFRNAPSAGLKAEEVESQAPPAATTQKGGKKKGNKSARPNDGAMRLVPRKALLMRAVAEYKRRVDWASSWAGYHPRLVLWGGPSFVSHSPLSQLTRMAISDLRAPPFRHTGRVLVGRVAGPLAFYVGATFVLDDPAGNAIPVALAHYSDQLNESPASLAQLLPPETLVAIREPYTSSHHTAHVAPATGKAVPGIRIDSPSDLVVLTPDHSLLSDLKFELPVEPLPQDPEGCQSPYAPPSLWMQLGPLAQHVTHPSCFTLPQDVSEQSVLSTVRHLYKQGRFEAAFREVTAARKLTGVSPHVLARLAAALQYAAQAYDAAVAELIAAFDDPSKTQSILNQAPVEDAKREQDAEALEDKLPPAPDGQALGLDAFLSRDLELLLSRCVVMSSRGKVGAGPRALAACYAASQAHTAADLAIGGQFTGPVEVADIPGAGRGLIATRDVAPGELLLVAQAVGGAYALEEHATRGVHVLRLDCTQGAVGTTTQLVAATRVVTQLMDRYDALASPILGLTAGPEQDNDPYVSKPYPLHWDCTLRSDGAATDVPPEVTVDAGYVDGVLRFNAFGPADPRAPSGELGRGTMPHPLPALLNHACLPSASSVFIGNTVITRSIRQLRRGEEITHPYVRGEQPYAVRQAQLSKHGFVCACSLCQADREDGEGLIQRQRMLAATWTPVAAHARQVAKGRPGQNLTPQEVTEPVESLRDFAQGLGATYSSSRSPHMRPEMVQVYILQAQLWAAAKVVPQAQQAYLDALACVGVGLGSAGEALGTPALHTDQATECMLALAEIASNEGQSDEAGQWIKTAVKIHAILAGASWSVFRDRWATERFAPLLDAWAERSRKATGAGKQ